jgi:hypothetical protein
MLLERLPTLTTESLMVFAGTVVLSPSEASASLDLARRCLQAMGQAQQGYRFPVARALAAPLVLAGEGDALYPLQSKGLLLAQQLALVESDLEEARRWGAALSALHSRQRDPEQQRLAHGEPLRQWRLEIGASSWAVAQAHQLLRQPPASALPPLVAALAQEPQATALAFALLLVLRRGGWLDRSASPPSPLPASAVPPRLWLLQRQAGSPALPERQAQWQALHPGWEVAWIDHRPEAIAAMADLPERVLQCALCVGDPSVRGDLLRLALLWQNGGVSVDAHSAPVQGLHPLLAGVELLLVQDVFGGIANALWAAPPHHPWVEAALLEACRNVEEGQGYSRWDLSGGCLLTGVAARWLQPALATSLQPPAGLRILPQAALGAWVQEGAPEPPLEGAAPEPSSPLLQRRRCSALLRDWGPSPPPLSLTTSWTRLSAAAREQGFSPAGEPEVAPAELAAWLLGQPTHPLLPSLEALLSDPPSWRQIFSLHTPPQRPPEPPPTLDGQQQAQLARQGAMEGLNLDWLPLGGQVHHTLQAIRARGRTPWILDAGTCSGRSALWLASHWPDAEVLALVQSPSHQALVAHTLAGSRVRWLAARPLPLDALQPDPAWPTGEGIAPLFFPLERLAWWLEHQGGEPLVLHLDGAMEGFDDLFAQGGAWLQPFPVVLLHGVLATDLQGRLLPQPHQQALAAAGFELLRSGEVLVGVQRPRLSPGPSRSTFSPADLPSLQGTVRQQGGVVAFDGEWQTPAITEQHACQLALQRLEAHPQAVFLAFPWASLIDHLNSGTPRGRALLAQLEALLPLLEGRSRRITVCQQIFFETHRWLFELAGITDLFWPHTTIHSSLPGLTLHPFPLYPVHWLPPSEVDPQGAARSILYSFIGSASSSPLYLSNSRDLMLSSLRGLPGSLIEGYDSWFYNDDVYGVQIHGTLTADDPRLVGEERRQRERRYREVLQRSVFALCPSGTGPNTIRLWEAIGSGAIPVVFSDRWRPPGPRQLWEQAVFFLPDTPEGVLSVPRLTAQWAADSNLLAARRAAMAHIWRLYGPEAFITDIEALWRAC